MISLCFLSLCCVVCMSSSFVRHKNAHTHIVKLHFLFLVFDIFFVCVFLLLFDPVETAVVVFSAAAAWQKQWKNCIFLWVIIIMRCKKWVCGTRHIPRLKTEKSVAFCYSGHYAFLCLCECKCVHMIPLRNALQIDFYVNVIEKMPHDNRFSWNCICLLATIILQCSFYFSFWNMKRAHNCLFARKTKLDRPHTHALDATIICMTCDNL